MRIYCAAVILCAVSCCVVSGELVTAVSIEATPIAGGNVSIQAQFRVEGTGSNVDNAAVIQQTVLRMSATLRQGDTVVRTLTAETSASRLPHEPKELIRTLTADTAGNPPPDGQYSVAVVGYIINVHQNKVGAQTERMEHQKAISETLNASFLIDSRKPQITALVPADGAFVNQRRQVISASFADPEPSSGINTASVQILLNGIDVTAQAAVTPAGFAWTPTQDLNEQEHVLAVSVLDRAGNAAAATWTFTADFTAPVVSNKLPLPGSFTLEKRPMISADIADALSGLDPDSLSVTLNGNNVDFTRTETGVTFVPGDDLSDQIHAVVVSVVDRAQNSTQATWKFQTDSVVPVVQLATAPVSPTKDQSPIFTGTFSDPAPGSGINPASIVIKLNGEDVTSSSTVSESGFTFQSAMPLAEGTHVLTAALMDFAGNNSDAAMIAIQIDVTAPVAPSNPTVTRGPERVTFIGQCEPDVIAVLATVEGAEIESAVVASWSVVVRKIPDGPNSFTLRVKLLDSAGNISPEQVFDGEFESTTPALTITGAKALDPIHTDDNGVAYFNANLVSFVAKVTGGASPLVVTVNGEAATGQADQYTATLNLPEGQHAITVAAVDAAGQTGQAVIPVVVDLSPPVVTLLDAAPATRCPQSGLLFTYPYDGIWHADWNYFQHQKRLLINKADRSNFALRFIVKDSFSPVGNCVVKVLKAYTGAQLRESIAVLDPLANNTGNEKTFLVVDVLRKLNEPDELPDAIYTLKILGADALGGQAAFSFDVELDTHVFLERSLEYIEPIETEVSPLRTLSKWLLPGDAVQVWQHSGSQQKEVQRKDRTAGRDWEGPQSEWLLSDPVSIGVNEAKELELKIRDLAGNEETITYPVIGRCKLGAMVSRVNEQYRDGVLYYTYSYPSGSAYGSAVPKNVSTEDVILSMAVHENRTTRDYRYSTDPAQNIIEHYETLLPPIERATGPLSAGYYELFCFLRDPNTTQAYLYLGHGVTAQAWPYEVTYYAEPFKHSTPWRYQWLYTRTNSWDPVRITGSQRFQIGNVTSVSPSKLTIGGDYIFHPESITVSGNFVDGQTSRVDPLSSQTGLVPKYVGTEQPAYYECRRMRRQTVVAGQRANLYIYGKNMPEDILATFSKSEGAATPAGVFSVVEQKLESWDRFNDSLVRQLRITVDVNPSASAEALGLWDVKLGEDVFKTSVNLIKFEWLDHRNQAAEVVAAMEEGDLTPYNRSAGSPGGVGGFGGPLPSTAFQYFQHPFRIANLVFNGIGADGSRTISCSMSSNVSSTPTNALDGSNSFTMKQLDPESFAYSTDNGVLGIHPVALPQGDAGKRKSFQAMVVNPIFGYAGPQQFFESGIGSDEYMTRTVTIIAHLDTLPDSGTIQQMQAELTTDVPAIEGVITTGAVALTETKADSNEFISADGAFTVKILRCTNKAENAIDDFTATVTCHSLGVLGESIDAIESADASLEFRTDLLRNNGTPLSESNSFAILGMQYRIVSDSSYTFSEGDAARIDILNVTDTVMASDATNFHFQKTSNGGLPAVGLSIWSKASTLHSPTEWFRFVDDKSRQILPQPRQPSQAADGSLTVNEIHASAGDTVNAVHVKSGATVSLSVINVSPTCLTVYMFSGHAGDVLSMTASSGPRRSTYHWKLLNSSASSATGTFSTEMQSTTTFTATGVGTNTFELQVNGKPAWRKRLEVLDVKNRASWGAVAPILAKMEGMPSVQAITVHHSAGSTSSSDGPARVLEIQTEHMNRGYSDIGYHYVMDRQGTRFEGRQLEGLSLPGGPFTKGSHVENNNTSAGIGVLINGNYENEQFPPARQQAVEKILTALCRRHSLSEANLTYHKTMATTNPTVCPGTNITAVFEEIKANVKRNLE